MPRKKLADEVEAEQEMQAGLEVDDVTESTTDSVTTAQDQAAAEVVATKDVGIPADVPLEERDPNRFVQAREREARMDRMDKMQAATRQATGSRRASRALQQTDSGVEAKGDLREVRSFDPASGDAEPLEPTADETKYKDDREDS